MINTTAIETYNKTRAYARNAYRPWNDAEIKALKESAPLLKFTLEKQTREIEHNNINYIIDVARKQGAKFVNITPDCIQIFNNINDTRGVSAANIQQCTRIVSSHQAYFTQLDANAMKIQFGWSSYESMIMNGSQRGGLYCITDDAAQYISKSKDIMEHIWQQGYIAQGTRTPLLVTPTTFSFQDAAELQNIVNIFEQHQLAGKWTSKFAKILRSKTQHMRFPGYADLMKRVRKLSK